MKTIKTEKIDGLDVIVGICDASGFIDPEATRKIVEIEIRKTPEWKSLEEKKAEMQVFANQAAQAAKNAKKAKTPGERNGFNGEYQENWKKIKDGQKEMLPIAQAIKKKYGELMLEHAKYFSLNPSETYVEDAEAEEIENLMIEATAAGEVVARDKTRVPDFRGRRYWKKSGTAWAMAEITRLGDKPASGAVEESKLSESQREEIADQVEKERMAGLSSAKRAAEKAAVIGGAVARAAQMKSELEVQGDSQALKKSKDWLAEETVRIEVKYA
jgi:hypothetical protein